MSRWTGWSMGLPDPDSHFYTALLLGFAIAVGVLFVFVLPILFGP